MESKLIQVIEFLGPNNPSPVPTLASFEVMGEEDLPPNDQRYTVCSELSQYCLH